MWYTISMKQVTQNVLEYTAIFEPAKEGGYVVSVPSLPGCSTQGETFEEAVKNIKDAIKGYIAVLKEEHETIPREKQNMIITKVTIANPQTAIV